MPDSIGLLRKMMRRFLPNNCLLVLAALLLFAGCRARRPENVLSPRKMESLLYDYHLAQAVVNNLPYEDKYQAEFYRNYEFQKHGVTKDEFDASVLWYTRNPKELNKIYEKLYARADRERDAAASRMEIAEKKSFSVMSGDSVDLWYLRRTNILTASRYQNPLLFEISSDTTFYYSDSIVWTVGTTFIDGGGDSIVPKAYLSLSMVYGDSISTVDTLVDMTSIYRLDMQSDPVMTLSSVKGAVSYIAGNDDVPACLLLSDISLLRIHSCGPEPSDTIASDSISSPEF